MRRLLPAVLVLVLVLVPVARAEAVSVQDIIDLTRAGLGDEVLLALIEVDGGIFRIDTTTLTTLKQAGVSERVILAMVKSGRTRPVEEPAPPIVDVVEPPPAPTVVIDHHDREVLVPVAVPVYVPVFQRHNRFVDRRFDGDFIDHGDLISRRDRVKPAEPVYWGFGGKLRPDAWNPSPSNIWGRQPQTQTKSDR